MELDIKNPEIRKEVQGLLFELKEIEKAMREEDEHNQQLR